MPTAAWLTRHPSDFFSHSWKIIQFQFESRIRKSRQRRLTTGRQTGFKPVFVTGYSVKVDRIRLDTSEKVNKAGCIEGALRTSQLWPNFQALQAVHGVWWCHGCAFQETSQFSDRLWSPSWYSYLLLKAGVPNPILFTLVLRCLLEPSKSFVCYVVTHSLSVVFFGNLMSLLFLAKTGAV